MQFLISRDLTFNVSPGCEGNVSSVACAHLHSFPKLKSSQIPMGPKCFCFHFVYQGSLKFIFAKLFSMNYYLNKQKRTLQIWVKLSLFTLHLQTHMTIFDPNFLVENLIEFYLLYVYRIDVQDEINMQVGKFLKNIKQTE